MEKITHLVSMVDFVKQFDYVEEDFENAFLSIMNYANFLSQPLELWMFVPVGDNGEVLHEPPIREDDYEEDLVDAVISCRYSTAKQLCLFEGFIISANFEGLPVLIKKYSNQVWAYLDNKKFYLNFPTGSNKIEDLADYKLKLTETALNQIY